MAAYSGRIGYALATCNAGLNSGEAEYRQKYGEAVEFDRHVSAQ